MIRDKDKWEGKEKLEKRMLEKIIMDVMKEKETVKIGETKKEWERREKKVKEIK